jgi:hypothetical protein
LNYKANSTVAGTLRKYRKSVVGVGLVGHTSADLGAGGSVSMATLLPTASSQRESEVGSSVDASDGAHEDEILREAVVVEERDVDADADVGDRVELELLDTPTSRIPQTANTANSRQLVPPTPAESSEPTPRAPSERETLRDMLFAIEVSMQLWQAHACLDADGSRARPHDSDLALVREIRSRATLMVLHGMAMIQQCSHVVEASELFYTHVASLRPSKVGGGQNAYADALVPPICRAFTRSPRPVKIGFNLLGAVGTTFYFLVLFDRFEPDSVQEWLACGATILVFPVIVSTAASFNARTVRGLLKEFETLYVLAFSLCAIGSVCLLIREHPAKMVCTLLTATPCLMLAGFVDATYERARVASSRVFFSLNMVSLITLLALFVFKLADYRDYTFHVLSFKFSFVATSIFCSTTLTLITFATKNIGLSVLRPGSLVTLVSDVCCVLLDAETLALLKAVYSLLGQAYGNLNYKANSTVAGTLRKYRRSILGSELMPAPGANAVRVAPAPAEAWP